MRPPPTPRQAARPAKPNPAKSGTARSGAQKQGAQKKRSPKQEAEKSGPEARPRTGATPRTSADARASAPRTAEVPAAARETTRAEAPGRAVGPATAPKPPRVSTAMADRLAERTAMRRHRAWRRVVGVVLALAALAGLVVGAFWSPVLALEADEVVVSGEGRTVDVDAVREIVEGAAGTPLPRLDTVAMREEILGLHGVKDVSLARAWPHGLRVTLTARVPVAAVPDGGRYVVLDSEGVRLGERSSAPAGLAEVTVPLDDARALQAALHVLAALPPRLEDSVHEVGARTQDAVTTVLDDGTTVVWGSSTDMPLKIEAMRTVRELDGSATRIDVSSPELPVSR